MTRIGGIKSNISEEWCDRMAPRTSGSNLGRSFVKAEEKKEEKVKEEKVKEEMGATERREKEGEEGKDALRHTLETMSLNKSQVNTFAF